MDSPDIASQFFPDGRSRDRWLMLLLFSPAALGLAWRSLPESLDYRLLSGAILLLLLEQARMAVIDLQSIATVQPQAPKGLERFRWITWSTIILELIGFYAAIGYLGLGALLVLLSQIWFHLLAGIEIDVAASEPVRVRSFSQRRAVLAADLFGVALTISWQLKIWPLMAACTLLLILLAYFLGKYVLP